MKDFKFTKEERDSIEDFALDQVIERNFGGIENVTDYIESLIQARADADGWMKVKAIKDESGHWYVIPNELLSDFMKDEADDDMVDSGEFDAKYGQCRTGGDLNLIQLYTPSPPKTESK